MLRRDGAREPGGEEESCNDRTGREKNLSLAEKQVEINQRERDGLKRE